MIHVVALLGDAPLTSATISFNPVGGSYSGSTKSVTVTVSSPKFRWKIDSGAYTTVNASSGVVSVPLAVSGHTLHVDALDSFGNVLDSLDNDYFRIVTWDFNPAGGSYSGSSLSVIITATGVPKLRWQIDSGAWTTVSADHTTATVPLSLTGHTLTAQALDTDNSVLGSHEEFYDKPEGGG